MSCSVSRAISRAMRPTSEVRSSIMRAVKSKDTSPELSVRRLVHRLGYRFRLYRADLPGKPDLAFVSRQAVIFVNGCFWHGHGCKRGARLPKTNSGYWISKIARNAKRDQRNLSRLRRAGWRVLIVWECQLTDENKIATRIKRFLDRPGAAKIGLSPPKISHNL